MFDDDLQVFLVSDYVYQRYYYYNKDDDDN